MIWVGSGAVGVGSGCGAGGVPFGGGGRTGQGGSVQEGLAAGQWCVGATALGPSWNLANSAITPHSEQLAHNGYPGTCSPSVDTEIPGRRPWRVQHGIKRSSPPTCRSGCHHAGNADTHELRNLQHR
ncbi:unnamed protein product [Pleuronectes platessa]|uniref:Uncharacterized protein n=1 Tax=Pleuronectes platessa TaxID=8262 RepID=A0A9N7UG55_PLEPL|nr:unnamed protein product [Pleuronectes platessa]